MASSFAWSGPASFHLTGPSADMSRQLNNSFALRIDWRIDAVGSGLTQVELGGKAFDVSGWVKAAPTGQVSTIKILLCCFADAGADLTKVGYATTVHGDKGTRADLAVGAGIEAVGENLACPPTVK